MRAAILMIGVAAGLAGGVALAAAPGALAAAPAVLGEHQAISGPAPGPMAVLVAGFMALGLRRTEAAPASAERRLDRSATLLHLPVPRHPSRARPQRPVEILAADAA